MTTHKPNSQTQLCMTHCHVGSEWNKIHTSPICYIGWHGCSLVFYIWDTHEDRDKKEVKDTFQTTKYCTVSELYQNSSLAI